MKKLLVLLALMLLPLAVNAVTIRVTIDGINYKLDTSNNTAVVIRWSGGPSNKYSGDIVIPPTVNDYGTDYAVTGIGNSAFDSCTELTSVTLPHTITSFGNEVFEGCTGLVSIVIEEGCQKYDSRENCNAIIETASNKLLYGCNSTIIPNSVTTIAQQAFLGCGLTSIIIPDGVTDIENEAFKNCDCLTSIYIGKGVNNIGYDAFYGCSNLTKVEINNNEMVSKSYEGLSSIGAFFGGHVKELILGEEVTSVGIGAFYYCNQMTSLNMSDNVTDIGEKAFMFCSQLTSIRLSNGLRTIGEYAFQNCQSLPSIIIPESMRTIGFWAFGWCFNLERVEIYSNEIVSGENHEQYYSLPSCFGNQVKEYIFGENVTCVGDSAFYNCQDLANVYCYAEQVPEIGKEVFVLSNYTNATLHVPAVSLEAYRNAEQWKDFGNIVALTENDPYTTGIKGVNSDTRTIECYYSIDGKRNKTPQRGLNIVKMSDGTVKKFIVK